MLQMLAFFFLFFFAASLLVVEYVILLKDEREGISRIRVERKRAQKEKVLSDVLNKAFLP